MALKVIDTYKIEYLYNIISCSSCEPISFVTIEDCQVYYIYEGCSDNTACQAQITITTTPFMYPLPLPSASPSALTYNCPGYSSSNTYNATQAYTNCNISVCGSTSLTISNCNGLNCYGYQYISLWTGGSNGVQLVATAGGCGKCAYMTYTVPNSFTCQTLTLRQGCESDNYCSGVMQVSGASKALSPTTSPSLFPSNSISSGFNCPFYSAANTSSVHYNFVSCESVYYL